LAVAGLGFGGGRRVVGRLGRQAQRRCQAGGEQRQPGEQAEAGGEFRCQQMAAPACQSRAGQCGDQATAQGQRDCGAAQFRRHRVGGDEAVILADRAKGADGEAGEREQRKAAAGDAERRQRKAERTAQRAAGKHRGRAAPGEQPRHRVEREQRAQVLHRQRQAGQRRRRQAFADQGRGRQHQADAGHQGSLRGSEQGQVAPRCGRRLGGSSGSACCCAARVAGRVTGLGA